MNMTNLSTRIVELRKSKGFTQEHLSEASDINLRTLQRIEKGETEPRSHTLIQIAKALEVELEELIEITKKEDHSLLALLHWSVLVHFLFDLGNIIVPLALWFYYKDKVNGTSVRFKKCQFV